MSATIVQLFPQSHADVEKFERLLLNLRTATTAERNEVIERLGEPLTHLIRNAIDHGIEDAEERQAAGKSAEGDDRRQVHPRDEQHSKRGRAYGLRVTAGFVLGLPCDQWFGNRAVCTAAWRNRDRRHRGL